jgi:Arc/MetJ-type ribon-helix-helix transcriptional regulator
MKTAFIPQVRVEPELRDQLESVLREGETLSEFVEASVRGALEFRRVETAFHARGDAAWQAFEQTGAAIPAEQVFDQLQTKLDERRAQLLRARG